MQIRSSLEVSQDADELGKITLSWSSVVRSCNDVSEMNISTNFEQIDEHRE